MGFLDSSGPPSKYKYNVKHCDEPLPFGKLKGFTLREIEECPIPQGDYFTWLSVNEFFGVERHWGTEIREIYQNILNNKKVYFEDVYYNHYDDYEIDYWGIF